MLNSRLQATGELSAVIKRADGSHRDTDLGKEKLSLSMYSGKLVQPLTPLKRLYLRLRYGRTIPASMTFAAFVHYLQTHDSSAFQFALVTQVGVNYIAADFLSSSSNHIANFNYHDSGTGTTAASTADTALITQAGPTTRATGTQSNPVAGTYRSVGTITYTSSLAITEWGIFSQAAQGGTLLDRRVFGALNVASGDSVTYTYSLQLNPGGS